MIDAPTFDAAPFIAAAYSITAIVVVGAIALTLTEARYWSRRARKLESEAAAPARPSEPNPQGDPQTN